MKTLTPEMFFAGEKAAEGQTLNLSRRSFLGAAAAGLVLGALLPGRIARAAEAAGKTGLPVPAFLQIRPDGKVVLQSPFVEGGQGIYTALAQIVGEELDVAPQDFIVDCAPPGKEYLVMNGQRFTGGSFSVRSSYDTMRRLGASARQMLLQAAAERLGVPLASLSTEPGKVIHAASGRSLGYGELAQAAASQPVPAEVQLRSNKDFRWIGKAVARLDTHDKSTGQTQYSIDIQVDGMLLAAIQHAPRLHMQPGRLANEADVLQMPGVHSIHRLDGAVAVLADRWWRARKAVEALQIEWQEAAAGTRFAMPADFSSATFAAELAAAQGPGLIAENEGDAPAMLGQADRVIEARYTAPFLAHGQLEPPSALAQFLPDGRLELWAPNQMPEGVQGAAAQAAGLKPEQVILHSPPLGGFFGRHFLYPTANPFPQAIVLAKAVGKPVKVIWSREEEFLRDAMRPVGSVRLRGSLNSAGLPEAIHIETAGEGVLGRWFGRKPGSPDGDIVEGLAGKHYAIAHRRVEQLLVENPGIIGFWRSVGHSMNDFFYESFLDELLTAGGKDPYEARLALLAGNARQTRLLKGVVELAGGWKAGVFKAADGTERARGLAMASPFGTEVATMAEVSLKAGKPVVHDIWVAIDPGSIVNPAIIEAQVNSAVALGLSSALYEEVVYQDGMPSARNFGAYRVMAPREMPNVHVKIIESGEKMGGIGEPGLPGVPPALANALAVLTGVRARSLPLAKTDFSKA